MPTFPAFTLTTLGLDMQAQAETGLTLTFSRIAIGAGAQASPVAATALDDEKLTADIQRFTNLGDGLVKLRAVFSNQGLATGFSITEVGVFALDPTTGVEKLHSYTTTETPDFMPALSGTTIVEQIFDAVMSIGTATSVTADIDDTIMLAVKDDTLKLLQRAVVGAGGAASIAIPCASDGYDEIVITLANLMKPEAKAYLVSDGQDGSQEAILLSSSASPALQTQRTDRVWLSRSSGGQNVMGTLTGLGGATGVAMSSTHAYVVSSTDGNLKVVDLSNPKSPSVVGTLGSLTGASRIVRDGTIVFVVRTAGISAISVATPSSPSLLGSVGNPVNYLAKYGTNYLVATRADNPALASLLVFNVSNPASMSQAGSLVASAGGLYSRGVAVVGSRAYVAMSEGGVRTVNLSNLSSLVDEGAVSGVSNALGVATNGTHVFVACQSSGTLAILELSNPSAPTVAGSLTGITGATSVWATSVYAYVTCSDGNLRIVDISTPAAPVLVGTVSGMSGPDGVAASGDLACVANVSASSLSVVDISTPRGGRITLWPGPGGALQFDAIMVSGNGRMALRSSGQLPAWTTGLTITSLDATGLLAAGNIVVRGRKAAE